MRRAGFAIVAALSLAVAGYGLLAYAVGAGGERLPADMRANFQAHAFGIRTHIFASALALLLGPFQFSATLRARAPQLHRWMGRVYLGGGVLVGGAAGLAMSQFAAGGWVAKLGFAGLAVAWLFTGYRAYSTARSRDFVAHRRWMIRNFALAFAAVTLRLYLPPALILQAPFEIAYPVIAWLCWVPNLLVAQWLLRAPAPGIARPKPSGQPGLAG
jgi:hypothetical protein